MDFSCDTFLNSSAVHVSMVHLSRNRTWSFLSLGKASRKGFSRLSWKRNTDPGGSWSNTGRERRGGLSTRVRGSFLLLTRRRVRRAIRSLKTAKYEFPRKCKFTLVRYLISHQNSMHMPYVIEAAEGVGSVGSVGRVRRWSKLLR